MILELLQINMINYKNTNIDRIFKAHIVNNNIFIIEKKYTSPAGYTVKIVTTQIVCMFCALGEWNNDRLLLCNIIHAYHDCNTFVNATFAVVV